MRWKPNVTVASIVEQNGLFLMVEENTRDGIRLNQPAGHLDEHEALIAACIRETQEETAYHVQVNALLGVYRWYTPVKDITYMRFAFVADVLSFNASQPLDDGIIRALWLSPEALQARRADWRSPLVGQCVQDYLAGVRYPLTLLQDFGVMADDVPILF